MFLPEKVKLFLTVAFAAQLIGPLPAQAQYAFLPAPGTRVPLSGPATPAQLKGIKVDPDNPFRLEFLLARGDEPSAKTSKEREHFLKAESVKLIKYFLAALTTPENDLWVNLSPYEKDRIVPESFGQTEMGRDLLAQDYMLKQITASLIYPEDPIGKQFWSRVYQTSAKQLRSTPLPVNTFNKVWIVPEKAVVYENANNGVAYVVESKLKIMLEEDYLALEKNAQGPFVKEAPLAIKEQRTGAAEAVREIILPQLQREVNEGQNFAQLRQIYHSLILATWYKKKIKDSVLSRTYADQNKVSGVNIEDSQEKLKIYQRYLEAFKKGAYNYIKEEFDPALQRPAHKKYFSGGIVYKIPDLAMVSHPDAASLSIISYKVTVDIRPLDPINNAADRAMIGIEVNNPFFFLAREGNILGVHFKEDLKGLEEEKPHAYIKLAAALITTLETIFDRWDSPLLQGVDRIFFDSPILVSHRRGQPRFSKSVLTFFEKLGAQNSYQYEMTAADKFLFRSFTHRWPQMPKKYTVDNVSFVGHYELDVSTHMARVATYKRIQFLYDEYVRIIHLGYIFQADEFGRSLERMELLLKRLGMPDGSFKNIHAALSWLNSSIVPYHQYFEYIKHNGVDQGISGIIHERFLSKSEEELKALATTDKGQWLKRAILNKLYPEEFPKRLVAPISRSQQMYRLRGLFFRKDGAASEAMLGSSTEDKASLSLTERLALEEHYQQEYQRYIGSLQNARVLDQDINVDNLVDTMDQLAASPGVHIVGADGPSGAGKSTILKRVVSQLSKRGRQAIYLDGDSFISSRLDRNREHDADLTANRVTIKVPDETIRQHELIYVLQQIEAFKRSSAQSLDIPLEALYNREDGGKLNGRQTLHLGRDSIVFVDHNYILLPQFRTYFDRTIRFLVSPREGFFRRLYRDEHVHPERLWNIYWRKHIPSVMSYLQDLDIQPDLVIVDPREGTYGRFEANMSKVENGVQKALMQLRQEQFKGYEVVVEEEAEHMHLSGRQAQDHLVSGPHGLYIHLHLYNRYRINNRIDYVDNGLLLKIDQLTQGEVILGDLWMENGTFERPRKFIPVTAWADFEKEVAEIRKLAAQAVRRNIDAIMAHLQGELPRLRVLATVWDGKGRPMADMLSGKEEALFKEGLAIEGFSRHYWNGGLSSAFRLNASGIGELVALPKHVASIPNLFGFFTSVDSSTFGGHNGFNISVLKYSANGWETRETKFVAAKSPLSPEKASYAAALYMYRQIYSGQDIAKAFQAIEWDDIEMNFKGVKESGLMNRVQAQTRIHGNPAMNGGVDFQSNRISLQNQDSAGTIKLRKIDPAMIQQYQNATGLVPVIIDLQPIDDIRLYLGLENSRSTLH